MAAIALRILDQTTDHGRTFANDLRAILGVTSVVLADTDARINGVSPFTLQAENFAIENAPDWADYTTPATAAKPEFLYFYFIALYRLACLVGDGVHDPSLLSEKSPDFAYTRSAEGMLAMKDRVCGEAYNWIELLGGAVRTNRVAIVDGSTGSLHTRGNGEDGSGSSASMALWTPWG